MWVQKKKGSGKKKQQEQKTRNKKRETKKEGSGWCNTGWIKSMPRGKQFLTEICKQNLI